MSRSTIDPDDAIRSTDDDAAASRLSAINLGYLPDPYTSLLYRPSTSSSYTPASGSAAGAGAGAGSTRKPPLINVGTHHRTLAVDLLVERFLDDAVGAAGVVGVGDDGRARSMTGVGGDEEAERGPGTGAEMEKEGFGQVVSLGAGSDSRFWRLRDKGKRMAKYIEIDFPHLTSLKAQRISRSPKLSSKLAPTPSSSSSSSSPVPSPSAPIGPTLPKPYTITQSGSSLLSSTYALLPLDLRQNPSETLTNALLPLLDTSKPILFIAECVFCYMDPEVSREIIGWFGRFGKVAGVVYEMCGLTDTFGQVMRRNLAARNLSIPGSLPFPDVQSQAERFIDPQLGPGAFESCGAKSLWDIRESVIDRGEIARIAKLEFLDEIEELRLVLSHYCVAYGSKGIVPLKL